MKLHTLLLPADGRIRPHAPHTDDAPHAPDTAACLAHIAELGHAVTLTVGRIVVMVAHEREGYAVGVYGDGALAGRSEPHGDLHAAFARYLAECAQAALRLGRDLETHTDALTALQPAPEPRP